MIAGQIEIQLMANIARLQRDMDRANRMVGDATASMARAADAAKSALAGIAAGIGLGQIARLADEYTKFTAQLKLATLSQREYAAAYADVKRIATQSTQGLGETGVLYARIANGTRELGIAQKQVAAITETVNLSLLVSGATASEAASAQLQLSQAFASGTLRGEEFNAVNEAAPRLMKALADGMGLPVGALKKMAEEGQITSGIMASVLPDALERLREEAKEVQTISGAFTVLKNNVMEFVGTQAQASGAVSVLTSAIGLLANNLGILVGAIGTLAVAKITTMFAGWAAHTHKQIVDNAALRASTLANAVSTTEAAAANAASKFSEAQANARASASAVALANARVAELRAAVLAARGADMLAIATNGLIPAQARAAALAQAHTVALAQQAVAGNAATVTAGTAGAALTAQAAAAGLATRAMGALRAVMAVFGGPLGFIVTLLGAAATAWMVFGNKAKEANQEAAESYEDAHARIVKGLDEQIDKNEKLLKLKNLGMSKSQIERDLPVIEQMAAASKRLADINSKAGEFTSMNNTDLLFARKAVMEDIAALTAKMAKNQATSDAVAAQSTQERVAALMKEHATKSEQMAADLKAIEDLKGKTELYGTLVARIRAKYADKGAAAAIAKEQTAYESLITSIKEKIAASELEAMGFDKMTAAQKLTVKLDAEIATGKRDITPQHVAEARALIATVAALDAANVSAANVQKATEALNDERASAYAAAVSEAAANEELVKTFGMSKAAIEQMELARMEARLSQRASLELGEQEVAQLERMIAVKRRNAAAVAQLGTLEQGSDLTRAKELLDVLTQVDEATKSAAASMTQSFGRVGTAIGGLTTALSGYARNQAAIAAQLAAVKSDKNSSPELIARAEIAAAKQSAQARVKSYGDMAGAAKSFFKENSTGYKVMEGTEKAFRAAEMAMAVEAMVKKIFFKEGEVAANMTLNATKLAGEATTTAASTGLAATEASAWGITAVVKALASLPFPANLAAGAATLAAVVAIGAKMLGGGSMNAGGMTAAEMQKRQGTGTVFGDPDAKSKSILKSLEMLEGHSEALIPINQSMLSALRNIESAMTGVTNILLRTPGVINGTDMGIQTGTLSEGPNGMAGKLLESFSKIPILGDFLGGKIAKLWGSTKQNIVDSGFQFGGSIRDLQNGVGYQQYASVDTTKKSWFGLSKKTTNSVQTAGIDGELADQIGLIFSGVDRALTEAARSMGMGADQVGAALDAMVIATTKVSLKDLKGEDLTAALNAVISKTMDDMAMAVFPAFDKFRQVGEGYAETVIRVASNYARLDATLSSIGMTFVAVGLDSLSARQSIIELSGGMDKFAEQADSFAQDFLTEAQRLAPVQKYVTEQMAALGYASVTTRQGFADIVLGLKLADPEQAKMYASLMALKDAFAAVTPAIDETTRSAKDIAEERASIDRKIFDLTHTAAEILARDRADELAALDATNRAQMLRYYALMDEAEATAKAAQVAIEANAAIEKARATAKQAVDAARADVQSAYSAEAGALQSAITAHQNYAKSIRQFKDSLLLGANSILSPEARYAEARRQLGEATPENFVAASNAFLEASKAYNGSTEAYARDFELAQRMADQAIAAADSAAMFASAQLSALNQQVQGILEVNKSVQSVREALLAYKAVGGTAGGGAMAGFTPGVPYTGGAMSMLQADGTFLNAIGPGFGKMYTDAEFAAIQAGKFDGSHAGGLDYVPFDGYRAELHKGERVQTAAAARDSDASAAESAKLLREVLDELRAANGQRGAVGTAQITVQERAEKRLASLERKLARAE